MSDPAEQTTLEMVLSAADQIATDRRCDRRDACRLSSIREDCDCYRSAKSRVLRDEQITIEVRHAIAVSPEVSANLMEALANALISPTRDDGSSKMEPRHVSAA